MALLTRLTRFEDCRDFLSAFTRHGIVLFAPLRHLAQVVQVVHLALFPQR
jgi:hypothetical protein